MKGHNFTTRITVTQRPADVERRRNQKDAGDAQDCWSPGTRRALLHRRNVQRELRPHPCPQIQRRSGLPRRYHQDRLRWASPDTRPASLRELREELLKDRLVAPTLHDDARFLRLQLPRRRERPYQRPKYSNKKIDPARGQRSLRLNCSP